MCFNLLELLFNRLPHFSLTGNKRQGEREREREREREGERERQRERERERDKVDI